MCQVGSYKPLTKADKQRGARLAVAKIGVKETAKACGVSVRTVYRWLKG